MKLDVKDYNKGKMRENLTFFTTHTRNAHFTRTSVLKFPIKILLDRNIFVCQKFLGLFFNIEPVSSRMLFWSNR